MLPKSQTARPRGSTDLLWLDRSETIWVLHVEETAAFDKVRAGLERALKDDKEALHGRNIHLGLGGRTLELFDVRRLSSLLREDFQASVVGVRCTAQSLHRHVEQTFKLKILPEGVFEPPGMPIGFTAAPLAPVPPEEPETAAEVAEVEVEEPAGDQTPDEAQPAEASEDEASEDDASVTDLVDADTLCPILDEAIPTDLPEFGDVQVTEIVELGSPGLESTIPPEGGRRVMVVERTLRSGSVVRFAGDVTVYGDVNAGAHIEADGNITVMGSLRGLAHAGARGDSRAVVIAFDMAAPQLRIATRIGFCSTQAPEPSAEATSLSARLQAASIGHLLRRDPSPHRTYCPEIAWVEGETIRFDTYNGHLPT
jgi:septum formation inhibitor MinC